MYALSVWPCCLLWAGVILFVSNLGVPYGRGVGVNVTRCRVRLACWRATEKGGRDPVLLVFDFTDWPSGAVLRARCINCLGRRPVCGSCGSDLAHVRPGGEGCAVHAGCHWVSWSAEV